MRNRKPRKPSSNSSEATGIGVGTFIVGISRFLNNHLVIQSFLIFIAPFAAVFVNTYLKKAYDGFTRSWHFNLIMREIDSQMSDPQVSPQRRERLLLLREELRETQLNDRLGLIFDLAESAVQKKKPEADPNDLPYDFS